MLPAATLHRRQTGLYPVQGLDLALLVDRQDQRALGRVQIQTDEFLHLLNKARIISDLEALDIARPAIS